MSDQVRGEPEFPNGEPLDTEQALAELRRMHREAGAGRRAFFDGCGDFEIGPAGEHLLTPHDTHLVRVVITGQDPVLLDRYSGFEVFFDAAEQDWVEQPGGVRSQLRAGDTERYIFREANGAINVPTDLTYVAWVEHDEASDTSFPNSMDCWRFEYSPSFGQGGASVPSGGPGSVRITQNVDVESFEFNVGLAGATNWYWYDYSEYDYTSVTINYGEYYFAVGAYLELCVPWRWCYQTVTLTGSSTNNLVIDRPLVLLTGLSADHTITGFDLSLITQGRPDDTSVFTIVNTTIWNITLVHNSGSSTTGNQIFTNTTTNFILTAGSTLQLVRLPTGTTGGSQTGPVYRTGLQGGGNGSGTTTGNGVTRTRYTITDADLTDADTEQTLTLETFGQDVMLWVAELRTTDPTSLAELINVELQYQALGAPSPSPITATEAGAPGSGGDLYQSAVGLHICPANVISGSPAATWDLLLKVSTGLTDVDSLGTLEIVADVWTFDPASV